MLTSFSRVNVRPPTLAAGVAILLAVIALPARASARPLRIHAAASHSIIDAATKLTLRAKTRPAATCLLGVRARHSRLAAPRVRASHSGVVEWSWLVPAKAPSGIWRLKVSCRRGHSHGHASRRMRVHTAGSNGFGPLIQHSTGQVLSGLPAEAPVAGMRAVASAARFTYTDPFPRGECTWWASLKRPDLWPAVNGNAGDWLRAAQRHRIPTGSTPAVGAIAVFFPYVGGAGGYGHVAYVEAVHGDGTIRISEYNYGGYHVGPHYRTISPRSVSGFIYGGPVRTPGYQPTPTGGGTGYNVYGTGSDGLFEHTDPDAASRHTGLLHDGAPVTIVCQRQSSSAINGSTIWDKLADGGYVSDYFVDTPVAGSFTPSIPRCNVPTPSPGPPRAGSQQHAIYGAPGGVALRNGPSLANAVVGSEPNGAIVTIVCQTKSASVVGTSAVWDLLTAGSWVPDWYVDTPVVGNYSPGLSQCGASPAPSPSSPNYAAPAGSQPQTHHVYGTGSDGLFERPGPDTRFAHNGWLPNGATIQIACQVKSASAVNGSPVWDLLTDDNFVSDYYVDTPVVGRVQPGHRAMHRRPPRRRVSAISPPAARTPPEGGVRRSGRGGDLVGAHEPPGHAGLTQDVPAMARYPVVADDFDALVQLYSAA